MWIHIYIEGVANLVYIHPGINDKQPKKKTPISNPR